MPEHIVQFRNVTKMYPGRTYALRNASFAVQRGEFVSIVGQSGTGKSTIVKLIISEIKPTRGHVVIGDWDITRIRRSDVPLLRRQIGVVFQDFKLLRQKTVYENVAFAMEVSGDSPRRIRQIVPQVLKVVGLSEKADRFPYQLSGGEQQRVVIARSFVYRPKLLVADEPTGNLDSINTREIIDLLLKINKLGTTVLLVTHNREVVNSLRRRVITLDQGMIISDQEKGKYIL